MQMAWLSFRPVMAFLMCSVSASVTQADPEAENRRVQPWEHPWTVVTMAPDGSWGAATEPYIYQAIAKAVSNCRRMSSQKIGCGAQLSVIRFGWTIALRCGNTNIIAAEQSIAAAESAAADRERTLRLAQAENLPPCSRVVTVNPNGNVIPAPVAIDRPDVAASAPN